MDAATNRLFTFSVSHCLISSRQASGGEPAGACYVMLQEVDSHERHALTTSKDLGASCASSRIAKNEKEKEAIRMKEKQTAPERLIVIDIKLTRGLVVALCCVLVLGVLLTYLVLAGESASASEMEAAQAASTDTRQFYLSLATVDGAGAPTACAAGYHMASLWEIADPSNLVYNTALGRIKPDSGQGPPTAQPGWVRTGNDSHGALPSGNANCNAWTSNLTGLKGSAVHLPLDWTAGAEAMGVWVATTEDCSYGDPVWCIED